MGLGERLQIGRRDEDLKSTESAPVDSVTADEVKSVLSQAAQKHQQPFVSDNPDHLAYDEALIDTVAKVMKMTPSKYPYEAYEPGKPAGEAQKLVGEINLFVNIFQAGERPKKGQLRYNRADWQKAQQVIEALELAGLPFRVRYEHLHNRNHMTVFFDLMFDSRAAALQEDKKRRSQQS